MKDIQNTHEQLTGDSAQRARERVHAVVAENVDGAREVGSWDSAESFVDYIETETANTARRRAGMEPESNNFHGARSEALGVAETGFRNGRTAALRARPGKEPAEESIESAAFQCEQNARQYSGHVPNIIYHGSAELCSVEALWDVYERAVSAGIDSVRWEPFGESGPVVYETESRGMSVSEAISDRLQIEPTKNGRPAYDGAIPRSVAKRLNALASGDTRAAFHFVYSYASGSLGALFPWTETGVELVRAYNEAHGSRYEPPERVARIV